mmetsp:Transcript_20814/g.46927  ORF Transcript_20814/g.46927 Transcript_20814/m.46927 type:complete len:253 (-) Transcript_20814:258-1016(-)
MKPGMIRWKGEPLSERLRPGSTVDLASPLQSSLKLRAVRGAARPKSPTSRRPSDVPFRASSSHAVSVTVARKGSHSPTKSPLFQLPPLVSFSRSTQSHLISESSSSSSSIVQKDESGRHRPASGPPTRSSPSFPLITRRASGEMSTWIALALRALGIAIRTYTFPSSLVQLYPSPSPLVGPGVSGAYPLAPPTPPSSPWLLSMSSSAAMSNPSMPSSPSESASRSSAKALRSTGVDDDLSSRPNSSSVKRPE